MSNNCPSANNPFACDYTEIDNNCGGCENNNECCNGGCEKCVPDFLLTKNRIYGCCASSSSTDISNNNVRCSLVCPVETTEEQSTRIIASKMLTLKHGPNFIGSSQKMNYAKKIKSTPGTYTFASKKYPYKQVNTGTNLSMVGSPQNWCTIQNPRSKQYASIGANVLSNTKCFINSDVCVLPVGKQFVKFCYKKCLGPRMNL